MSEPTPREALREKIAEVVENHYWDGDPIRDEWKQDIEQLINAEVLAILTELGQINLSEGIHGVDKAITQLKQRYGGKEQE